MRTGAVSLVCLALFTLPGAAQERLALRDGDRIVFLGSALVEYDQFHGYLETRLLRHAAVNCRNLGWSGDTVRGDARTSGFENPDGMARLLREVQAQKPTVLIIGYGNNESFAGADGVPAFLQGYGKLLDDLAGLKAHVVLLSPTPQEDLGRPYPDPAPHNRDVETYTGALKKFAEERHVLFVDLFHPLAETMRVNPAVKLTSNGLLLNAAGYWLVGAEVERQLKLPAVGWNVQIDVARNSATAQGAKVSLELKAQAGSIRFRVSDAVVPIPFSSVLPQYDDLASVTIHGLTRDSYWLKSENAIVVTSAENWNKGAKLSNFYFKDDAEKLRKAVVTRNELFYRRWRPYNDHSRHWGFMAGDFKLYDDEIARQEEVVIRLRHAAPHEYELVEMKESK